jgi:hypothetical protein
MFFRGMEREKTLGLQKEAQIVVRLSLMPPFGISNRCRIVDAC